MFNAYIAVPDKESFCQRNFLKQRQLERATRIRRQIENVYASTIKEEAKENDQIVFTSHPIEYRLYYENIIKTLLSGHFMNIAFYFSDNYWRFRLLDLDANNKAIDIIDKAKAHQNSMFAKNNAMNAKKSRTQNSGTQIETFF